MPRCGCSDECNCVLNEGEGIDISGAGTDNTPYVIEFDGGEVAGNGIAWDGAEHLLSVKIAPGGGLAFDGSGALQTTGDPGGGGTGWTTIADLEARGDKLVIGHAGAGYMIKPEGLLRSYEYGQHIGLDMMHVPIRFLQDGTPVVYGDETLGRTVGEPWALATWQAKYLQEQTGHEWGISPSFAGLGPDNPYLRNQPDGDQDPTIEFGLANWTAKAKWHARSPSFGYLGYREKPQYCGTLLADVFREIGGRTCLLLELRWPAMNVGTGEFIQSTPPWKTGWYLRNVLSMIQRFGLAEYVVVTSTEMTIPTGNPGITTDVLATFSNAGIRVGPHLTTAKLATHPTGTWPATWTWATFHPSVTDAQIAPYVALNPGGNPLRTILTNANRHHQWSERIVTGGMKGGTSADPVYAYALTASAGHPLHDTTFRQNVPNWQKAVVLHGLIPPNDNNMNPYFRAILEPGQNRALMGPQMVPAVAGTTYHVLQGWGAPLPQPDDVYFDFEIGYDAFESPRSQPAWIALAFSRNRDSVFSDWNPAPGADVNAQSGYMFTLTHLNTATDGVNPNMYLYGYTGGAVATMGTARTGTSVTAGAAKRIRVGINFRGIRISEVDGGGALTTRIEVRTAHAQAYRGGYFHLGRFSQGNQGWYGWVRNFSYVNGGGAAAGPQP